MGWDRTIPAPIPVASVVYSDVSTDSESILATANCKIASVFAKLSDAVPATKALAVTVKVNGTAVSAQNIVPADGTAVKELVINKLVQKGDEIVVALVGSDNTVFGVAQLTVGIDA